MVLPSNLKKSYFAYFQTFLGQKYGYRPFPTKIIASEFEKLLGAIDNKDDHQLLRHWFWKDENAVPAQYVLQPITSLLPHYRDYENNELRKKASGDWWAAFERMQVVFRMAADKALDNNSERHKYYMSGKTVLKAGDDKGFSRILRTAHLKGVLITPSVYIVRDQGRVA